MGIGDVTLVCVIVLPLSAYTHSLVYPLMFYTVCITAAGESSCPERRCPDPQSPGE